MAGRIVRFEFGNSRWVPCRESVGFIDTTDLGAVEFLITSAALAERLDLEFNTLDADTAIETFIEFQSDIHRFGQLEFVNRLGGEPPILLTSRISGSRVHCGG